MSCLEPRCRKISLLKSCTALWPAHKSSREPCFVSGSFAGCFRNTSLIFSALISYLNHLHPVYICLFFYQQSPSAFPPCASPHDALRLFPFFILSPPPFHHTAKGRKPSSSPPHLPLPQRSSLPHQGQVPSSPAARAHAGDTGPSWGKTPALSPSCTLKPSPSSL